MDCQKKDAKINRFFSTASNLKDHFADHHAAYEPGDLSRYTWRIKHLDRKKLDTLEFELQDTYARFQDAKSELHALRYGAGWSFEAFTFFTQNKIVIETSTIQDTQELLIPASSKGRFDTLSVWREKLQRLLTETFKMKLFVAILELKALGFNEPCEGIEPAFLSGMLHNFSAINLDDHLETRQMNEKDDPLLKELDIRAALNEMTEAVQEKVRTVRQQQYEQAFC